MAAEFHSISLTNNEIYHKLGKRSHTGVAFSNTPGPGRTQGPRFSCHVWDAEHHANENATQVLKFS